MSTGLPEHTIIRDDKDVREKYVAMQYRQSSLRTERSLAIAETDQILGNLGALVANDCDVDEMLAKLAKLRLRSEALELGIAHIVGQVGLMKRLHSWLK